MNRFLNKLNLLYLGFLPSIATFFILSRFEKVEWIGIPIFFIGTGAVAVYLSTTISYSRPIKNTLLLVLIILDGPIYALLANIGILSLANVATEIFFIESVGLWVSIFILALISGKPGKVQMGCSTILMIAFLFGISYLYFITGFFDKPWYLLGPLVLGIIETIILKYKVLYKDQVTVNAYDTIGFVVGFLFLWLVSMILGGIVANS